ncbi:MAG: TerC family protein [Bdellovibrionales bacterium]|nr:TerC family protein [Bdellovibrionales bacterium]
MEPTTTDPSLISMLIGLFTLVILQIVLVVDNALIVVLECQSVKEEDRPKAINFALAQGGVIRLILLYFATWLVHLNDPIVFIQNLTGYDISVSALIMLGGAALLGWLAVSHIAEEIDRVHLEGHSEAPSLKTQTPVKERPWLLAALSILPLNIVFSIDAVLSAVGMVDQYWIMAVAIGISVVIMIFTVKPVGRFINNHPLSKLLALCFVIVIAGFLFLDGMGIHVPKGYIYAMGGFGVLLTALHELKRHKTNKYLARVKALQEAGIKEHLIAEHTSLLSES